MSQRTGTWRQGEQALRDRPRVIAESKAAEAQCQKQAEERQARMKEVFRCVRSWESAKMSDDAISFTLDGHRYEIREVD